MKKLSFYITLALMGLFMGACSDDYTDWANPQSNPQEDAITIPGYKASAVNPINLGQVTTDSVSVFSLSSATLPAGYSLTAGRIVLTPQGVEGATATTINTSVTGLAAKADLQSLIQSVYGKRPEARTFKGHVYTSVIKNGEACLIDAGEVDVVATPSVPYIENAYYVIGGTLDWTADQAKTQKFSHSGANIYDDPVFTITIKAKENDDTWFAIVGEKELSEVAAGKWDNVLGATKGNGNNAYDGTVESLDTRANIKAADKTAGDCSFKVPASTGAKYIQIEINMMDYTYKITPLAFQPTMYVAGDGNGWAQADYLTTSTYDGNYDGFMYLGSEFKICTQQNWDGTNYGKDFSTDGGAGNMTVPGGEGYYKMHVNFLSKSVELTPITRIGVIGDATVDGWNSDQAMTYNKKDRCWEISNLKLTDGTIKFRANNGWDINWGGKKDKLTQGGDNIAVSAGTYSIKLYAWADGFAKCELTKK